MPEYLVKHAAHSPVFGIYPSGVVRYLGPEELEHLDRADVPTLSTTSEAEYNRLICASYAAMGLEPPAHNAAGV